MEYQRVTHEFEPIYDEHSNILILGSLPSVKSREQGFYYGHPQNRFWRVIAALTGEPVPETIAEKKRLLLAHGIAVWDVIESCEIIGSSDSSIRDVKINDFGRLLSELPDIRLYANGTKAYELYQKYAFPQTGRKAIKLPSTSPANASWGIERLCGEWRRLLEWE